MVQNVENDQKLKSKESCLKNTYNVFRLSIFLKTPERLPLLTNLLFLRFLSREKGEAVSWLIHVLFFLHTAARVMPWVLCAGSGVGNRRGQYLGLLWSNTTFTLRSSFHSTHSHFTIVCLVPTSAVQEDIFALEKNFVLRPHQKNFLFPVAKMEEDRVGRSVQNFLDLKILVVANYSCSTHQTLNNRVVQPFLIEKTTGTPISDCTMIVLQCCR